MATLTNRLNRVTCFFGMSAVLILVGSVLTLSVKASRSLNIYPPDSKPYNLTFAEHAKNYWKWALKIPASDNPVNDQTGEKCAEGQSNTNSSVFYLSF